MGEGKKLQIRNSTVDFLVFTKDAEENGIEVRVQEENVWLTQKAIGQLFDIDRSVVTRVCFKTGRMPDWGRFFRQTRRLDAGILTDFKSNQRSPGGKRCLKTAF